MFPNHLSSANDVVILELLRSTHSNFITQITSSVFCGSTQRNQVPLIHIYSHSQTFSNSFSREGFFCCCCNFAGYIYVFADFSSLQQLEFNVTDDFWLSSDSLPCAGILLHCTKGSVRSPDSSEGTKHLPSVQRNFRVQNPLSLSVDITSPEAEG